MTEIPAEVFELVVRKALQDLSMRWTHGRWKRWLAVTC